MHRRIAAFLVVLSVLCLAVYAQPSLLTESVLSASAEELAAMSAAYGLDGTLSVPEMQRNLLEYFGISEEETEQAVSSPDRGTQVDSIEIGNADSMVSSGRVVILSGNVGISFTTGDSDKRSFSADRVVVDLDRKILEASGSVLLSGESGDGRVFSGGMIHLDWEKLDVMVFDGISSTTRSNSDGTKILFYAKGDSIAYNGSTGGIFFRNGTIATTVEDPYWSIQASKLSLTENDFFIDRAVFRLGRVPVFYFPVFFYPGTTLSFNPALGYSSVRGVFLNTTVEIYGKYPKLGLTGTKSDKDDTDYSASISSFLSTEDDREMVRDGWYYRPLEEGEDRGPLEAWAKKTGSYLAAFADVYENLGLVLGLDTKNSFLNDRFTFSFTGAAGYSPEKVGEKYRRFRYSFDLEADYRVENLRLKVSLPSLSDPEARGDFLNRNTAFTLDSVLGSEQYFHKSYPSSVSTYTWSADASYSLRAGNYSFNLNSLKADIDFKFKTDSDGLYKPSVVEASLPYLSFSSNGTFLNMRGERVERIRNLSYTSDTAQEFADELAALDASPEEDVQEETIEAFPGPVLNLEEKTISEAGSLKMGYTYTQSLDNRYAEELKHDSFYTKIDGSLYLDGSLPGQWFSLSETLRPKFNFSADRLSGPGEKKVEEFYLTSVLKVSVPKIGLTYNLSHRIFSHYALTSKASSELNDRWGGWDRKDVTAHNATLSHRFGNATLGFYVQFRPLAEILRPSASYSRSGFSASADFSFKRPDGSNEFEKDVANLNLSYTGQVFSASLAGKYDFTKSASDAWSGFTLVQKASLKPLSGLLLTQNASFKGRFETKTFSAGLSYTLDTGLLGINAAASISFKDREFTRDALNTGLNFILDKVTFWKGRIGLDSSLKFAFNYDFNNPYKTMFTVSWQFGFSIAEFLDLVLSVNSANKSFIRYYEGGDFSFALMMDDLLKSFDFFGDGRRSTAFNLSSVSLRAVHHMRDWDLNIDVTGGLATKYSQKYEWATEVTVFIRWNAIPELKQQASWNSKEKEWK